MRLLCLPAPLSTLAAAAMALGLPAPALLAQPCEPHWESPFPCWEPNRTVRAQLVFDDGRGGGPTLYIAGAFEDAGGPAVRVARWAGDRWEALGDGLGSHSQLSVYTLCAFDDGSGAGPQLCAGGDFRTSGSTTINRVARWDGTRWQPFGAGLNNTVRALAVFDDGSGPALYAAGDFTRQGASGGNGIAKWNGQDWVEVGGGLFAWSSPGAAYTLHVYDDGSGAALLVGGNFSRAADVPANRIVKWTGASWVPLGGGITGGSYPTVYCMLPQETSLGPSLVVGGSFGAAGGQGAPNIARWQDGGWHQIGAGFDRAVLTLAEFDGGEGSFLYAGGYFAQSNGHQANNIARWSGVEWSPLGEGTDLSVEALVPFDDGSGPALYCGGGFRYAGGLSANFLCKWRGNEWIPLSTGPRWITGMTRRTADNHSSLVASGWFPRVGDEYPSLAKYEDRVWSFINPFPLGQVYTVGTVDLGEGERLIIDAVQSSNLPIQTFIGDGQTWELLPASRGTAYAPYVVADLGGGPGLYAPYFEVDAQTGMRGYAGRWNGVDWTPLGDRAHWLSNGTDLAINAMVEFDDGNGPALYLAGAFGLTDAGPVYSIARWSESGWQPLGGGLTRGGFASLANAFALAVFDDRRGGGPALYVGGWFDRAGDVAVHGIARWDGHAWSDVGGGLSQYGAGHLYVFDDGRAPALFAAAGFSGSIPGHGVARWDGVSWLFLGEGVSPLYPGAVAMQAFDDGSGESLWFAGEFTEVDGRPAGGIAKWVGCPSCPPDWNHDGVVDTLDFFDFLAAFFAPSPDNADFNGDGLVNSQDFFDFLALFFAGC